MCVEDAPSFKSKSQYNSCLDTKGEGSMTTALLSRELMSSTQYNLCFKSNGAFRMTTYNVVPYNGNSNIELMKTKYNIDNIVPIILLLFLTKNC